LHSRRRRGSAAAVPNPDGSRTSASRDFLAHGVANAGGALFQALPTGGSLSGTGVAVSAGAQTRWAGMFAGLSLALVVLLFGSLAEHIPMAVIGGLVSRLVALEREPGGAWRVTAAPVELPSRRVTVLHREGVGLFAEIPRLDETWRRLRPDTRRAVVVLSLRALPDVPSTTAIKAYESVARRLEEHDSRLLLAGVEPPVARILDR
jgi:SulP family sulfate permease